MYIVMKGNRFDANADAREIFCKFGIDLFCGCENLVIARNWCHSEEYADRVLELLESANSYSDAVAALNRPAGEFEKCNWEDPAVAITQTVDDNTDQI